MSIEKFLEKKLWALVLLLATLLWTSCTVEGADDEIAMPEKEEEEEQPLSLAEEEFYYTYDALKFFYLAANTYLWDEARYMGLGEKNGFSPDYYEYPDIYFMYSKMNDPYTAYFGPYYAKKADFSSVTEKTYNLGVTVEAKDSSGLVVTQVFLNGPGAKAGLKEGDTILSVGATVPGDIEGFNKLTSGKDNDTISLNVLRGKDSLNIKAPLFCYMVPTVYVTYKDSIPIIKITEFASASAVRCEDADENSFENGTADEFNMALKATKGATVIDLRGNPGGALDQCFATAEALLSKGDTLIIREHAEIAPDTIHQMILIDRVVATENGAGKGRYYVFLTDTNSASCTEVMLMGVTPNLKSPIVGTITYGKSIAQYYIPTIAEGFSIITSTKMYDKTGASPHDYGFLPDYEIADSLKALDKAVELAKAGKEKRSKGYGTQRLHHFTDVFVKKASNGNPVPRGGAYMWKEFPLKAR